MGGDMGGGAAMTTTSRHPFASFYGKREVVVSAVSAVSESSESGESGERGSGSGGGSGRGSGRGKLTVRSGGETGAEKGTGRRELEGEQTEDEEGGESLKDRVDRLMQQAGMNGDGAAAELDEF